MRTRRILFLILLSPVPLWAATYYVGPTSTGNGSGSDRDNLMAFSTALSGGSPDDVFLLQPGSYGTLTPTCYGSSGHPITYRADPATCTARAANWYEGDLERPSSSVSAVVSQIASSNYQSGGEPLDQNLLVEDLFVVCTIYGGSNGAIDFGQYAAEITVRGCSVFGREPADTTYHFHDERTNLAIAFYHASGKWRDITVESCYAEFSYKGVQWYGPVGDGILIKDCHIRDCISTQCSFQDTSSGNGTITVDGCHFEQMTFLANSSPELSGTVYAEGSPANMQFTYEGTIPSYNSWVYVTHAGQTALRPRSNIVDNGNGTVTVTVGVAFPWAVAVSNPFSLHETVHGSGVSLRSGSHTIRNCRIHNCWNTGAMYAYITGLTNVIVENCLVYDPPNNNNLPVNFNTHKIGENWTIRNNTFASRRHQNYPSNKAYHYGYVIEVSYDTGVDPDTLTFSNNLVLGLGKAYATHCRNNIVYSDLTWDCFQTDSEGNNQGNTVYQSGTQDPAPFDSGFFVGGTGFVDLLTGAGASGGNFNGAFKLVSGSDAVNYGYLPHATPTDHEDQTRDANPDAGFDELDGDPPTTHYLLMRSGS